MIPFQVVRCVNTDQGTVQATDTGSDLNYYQLKTAVKHVLRFLAKLITLCFCLIDQQLVFLEFPQLKTMYLYTINFSILRMTNIDKCLHSNRVPQKRLVDGTNRLPKCTCTVRQHRNQGIKPA